MRFRGKRETIVLVIAVCVIAVGIYPKNNVTHAIDPFFTLVAYAKGPLAMDYFNLIREQLWRVGIHLDIIQPSVFQWDQSGMHDLEIQAIYNSSIHSPFMREHYSENGTYCLYGYDETLDWVDDLNTGRNQWYIENGLEMITNNSENVVEFCWEWQNYMMDKVLPCLPLFQNKNDNESFHILRFNLDESHPVIASRELAPGNIHFTKGLVIRKVISYAINREEIKRVVLGDDYTIVDHPISPLLGNWCNPNVVRYCHDLDVARKYFDIAGYSLCWNPNDDFVDTFPDWTNWDAVCSRNEPNEPTIDVAGFTLIIASISLGIPTVIFIIYTRKRK